MNQTVITQATVLRVSESGKSLFVKVKRHAFDNQGIAGYCANPGNLKVGDVIEQFPMPTGVEHRKKPDGVDGELMCTEKGEPLQYLTW